MKTRVRIATSFALGLAALLLGPASLTAQQHEPFTEARFEALQADSALILVEVFAPWCPTCAAQQQVLAAFRARHPEVPLRVLRVDFDSQKQWVRHFSAPRQSTLILYRGRQRVWFSVAETRAEVIFAQLTAAAGG